MTGVLYKDDSQIVQVKATKVYASSEEPPGAFIRIYVKDLVDVCIFLMEHRKNSGIYNLGTGKARSFNDLGKSTFTALDKPVQINYIDTPLDIRDKYQCQTVSD